MQQHWPTFMTKWMSTASSGNSWDFRGDVCLQGHNSNSELLHNCLLQPNSQILIFRRNCCIGPPLCTFCPAAQLTRCSHCPLVSSILQPVTCPSTASQCTVNFIWIIYIHVLPLPHFRQKKTPYKGNKSVWDIIKCKIKLKWRSCIVLAVLPLLLPLQMYTGWGIRFTQSS